MPLKLFEVHEQLMIDTFLIKSIQLEKTESIGKFLIPLGNLKIKFHSLNEVDHVFRELSQKAQK